MAPGRQWHDHRKRGQIPLLLVSLEPSLVALLRSTAGRNSSGVSFLSESERYLCLSCGGGGSEEILVMWWLFEMTSDQLIGFVTSTLRPRTAFGEMIS